MAPHYENLTTQNQSQIVYLLIVNLTLTGDWLLRTRLTCTVVCVHSVGNYIVEKDLGNGYNLVSYRRILGKSVKGTSIKSSFGRVASDYGVFSVIWSYSLRVLGSEMGCWPTIFTRFPMFGRNAATALSQQKP